MLKANLAICSYYKVLPTEERFQKLTWIQKLLLFSGMSIDKNETTKLVLDTVEVLKPWLDKELWTHMEKQKDTTRENENWGK